MSWRGRGGASALALSALGLLAILVLFFGALFDPGTALATRDMLQLHLPLRTAWAELAATAALPGFPQWDPRAHGGQPLLSNPHYGAFYPPNALALLLPVTVAINLLVLLHAALAFSGALRLARRLGADGAGAWLAAIAYTCGPTYLALLHLLPLPFGMSWLPWVLAFALERLAGDRHVEWRLAAALAMLVLAAGEPVLLATTMLALGILVVAEPRRALPRARALSVPILFGGALACVQIVPTFARLLETRRAQGLDLELATSWSLAWKRLPELWFPHLHGDLTRPMDGLYFGWGVHDFNFPLLPLLAIGGPLLILGLAGLVVPRLSSGSSRVAVHALAGFVAAGLFLALGRHNPFSLLFWEAVPLLRVLRYPEKFALLALTGLVFLGALGLRRLLDQRDRAAAELAQRPRWGSAPPLAISAGLLFVTMALAAVVHLAPERLEQFVRSHSGWPLAEQELARAVRYFHVEVRIALAFAAASLTLFVAARFTRWPRRTLELGAMAIVLAELVFAARPLLRTVPASLLLAPPRALVETPRTFDRSPGRIFAAPPDRTGRGELVVRGRDAGLSWARAPLDRLDARTGNLVGLDYALDEDFDLTLTRPAARALDLHADLAAEPELAARLLGAWSAERIVVRRAPAELLAELRRGVEQPAPVRLVENPHALAPVRFLDRYETFPTVEASVAAARAAGLPLDRLEFLAGAPEASASAGESLGIANLRADRDRGDRRRIDYTSARPSLLVVSSTYDPRWRARIAREADEAGRSTDTDTVEIELFETAGGYLAAIVPAGTHRLELSFRDPWVAVGASLTLAGVLALILRRRRDRAATPRVPQDRQRHAGSLPTPA